MNQDLFLTIDQGGHASRAIVFDCAGNIVAQAIQEVGVNVYEGGRVEQDPLRMLESLRLAVDEVVARLGDKSSRLRSAGLATQRSSIVCWDRNTGLPLSPIISWQDTRMAAWLEAMMLDADQIHHKTGLFPNAHYGASKLRWCLDNLPEVRSAQQDGRLAMGPMASYLVFNLLSERPLLIDPANASRTLLWNRHHLGWDEELLALFGVSDSVLPRCVSTRFEYGHIDCQGLSIPLRIVTGDQSAAIFAYGEPDTETVYVNAGTGAFVQRCLPMPPAHTGRMLSSVLYQRCGDALYSLEGTVNGAGSALAVVEAQLGMDPKYAERQAEQWLGEVTSPPIFLNGISGLGAPFWVANFSSEFIGAGGDREKIVAVIESIVFLMQENISEMTRYLTEAKRIVLSGGLARLDGLCQRLADISAIPVVRAQECEATARGTAFLLAGRPADWSGITQPVVFEPYQNRLLLQRHSEWVESMLASISALR